MNEHFPHSHRPSASSALVIVATLILAGCDATRSTAAPQPTTSVPESPSYGQSAALGSSNVFIPNTNGFHESGYAGWQLTPIQVPGGTWTHVEVSGGVSYTRNPDCYVASNPCGAPLAGSTTGPLHHGGSSRISVAHQAEGGSRSTYRLFPRDGDAQTAMSAYALRYHATPQTIWVQRHMAHSGTWDPIAGTWRGFEYYLGGSQTVTVYEVPKPLRVVAPAAVTPGGTGTFRAEIVGPFDIRMPAGAGGGYFPLVRWTYMRGDTLAHQTGRAVNVTACNDLLECEFKPEVPGRMYVVTYPGGEHVSERSEIVRVQERELKLTCPETVVRGQTMTCTVAAVPSGTLTDIRWLFQDTVGYTLDGPENATSWGGVMVIGGSISVSAVLDGDTLGATTAISVRPRTWRRLRIEVREENPNHLPEPHQVTAARHLGDIHVDSIGSLSSARIDHGPNLGWSYLTAELGPIPITVHINEPAFAAGSAWYNLQTGGDYTKPDGTVVPNGYCTGAQVPTLRRATRQHEGTVNWSGTSHVDVFRRYLQNNPLHEVMEARVVRDDELGQLSIAGWFRLSYGTDIVARMMGDPNQNHTNHEDSPGLVDLAHFPCYARPWR